MPEIPELEGITAFLRPRLVGTTVAVVRVGAISAIKSADPGVSALPGSRVLDVRRAGKFLVLDLADDNGEPLITAIHLARAGWLKWLANPPATPVRPGKGPLAARFVFVSDDGEAVGGFDLTEAGTQKSLAIHIARADADVPGIARLGPDPLSPDFDRAAFAAVLSGAGKSHLKTVLRDQSIIAGVGNAYSDEILHAARLSPAASADSLTDSQADDLYAALRQVLDHAVAIARTRPPADLKDGKRTAMRVHGRPGESCPVCGSTIASISTADSNYQYCPTCQTGGRPLADRRLSRLLK